MTTITFLLLLVCAGAGYYFWKSSQQDKEKQLKSSEPVKPYKKDELRIENAGAGAVIHLTGIGPELDEFDLKVIAKHTYRQGESTWYEFECDKGTDKVWLDMEEDDDLELAISLRELKLREIGLSKEDLVKMDDDEEGSFEFEGDKYWLEDSDNAVFYRYSDDKNTDPFYYWDFENDAGGKYIGVEKWSDGKYDIRYSEKIKPSQLTVYSLE